MSILLYFFHVYDFMRFLDVHYVIHITRALRRGHSLSQHTQFLKNNMIAEKDLLGNFDIFYRTEVQTLPSRLHLARFARARFAHRARENFRKKSVSQSTRNALKRIEMQKNFFYPFDVLRASRVAQSPSGVAY